MEKATFAAGCFWGVEDKFRKLNGVISSRVGYTGGHTENPFYQEVCSGSTGHAEAVEVIFNSEIISYKALLDLFWKIHNPTTLNRQGFDVGTQYRSAIFYHTEQQKELAIETKPSNAVTEIVVNSEFWEAEDYHQQYYQKTGRSGC